MNHTEILQGFVCFVAVSVAALAQAAPAEPSRSLFVHNVIANHFVPGIAVFARAAPQLAGSMESLCKAPTNDSLKAARSAWIDTMLAWEGASAVGFGPLLGRRSVSRIDYWPARANLIAQALKDPPTTTKGLELIGGPAKGLPAIEWLLWTPAERPDILVDSERCAYARLLALDVDEESHSLDTAFVAFAASDLPEKLADDLFAGLLNLAYGELEQLSDKKVEIPARVGNGKNFPRILSGQTVEAWRAQWSSIRSLLLTGTADRNDNLEAFLRAENLAPVADKLRTAADVVSKTLQSTSRATPAAAVQVAKEIRAVRAVLGDDVASALKIPVQFGANDGD